MLAAAVATRQRNLHEMSVEDPSLEGMGTTLTALLWSGPTVALCHIGDSRAYLLRDGDLHQITRDHTLVQSLVDDGRLSPAQAATHPQRSLVMRALQSSDRGRTRPVHDPRPRPGTGTCCARTGCPTWSARRPCAKTLIRCTDRDEAVGKLIDLAIRGGGPDNITCIVADVVEAEGSPPAGPVAVVVGAASNGDGRPRPHADTPAERAQLLTQAGPLVDTADPESAEAPAPGRAEDGGGRADHRAARRRWPVVTTILVVLVIVIVGGGYAAWRYTQDQYYVGTDGSQVIIYRGVDQRVLGLNLSSVYQRTGIPLAHVPANDLPQVKNTITASSLANAQKTVSNIRQTITCNSYDAAYAKWAALPTTRKVTVTVGGKKEVRTEPVQRPAAPKTPTGCTPQGTSG